MYYCLFVVLASACFYTAEAGPPLLALADGSLIDFIGNADNSSHTAGFRFRRQAARACKYNEWRCRDGACIDIDELCDGIPNCKDRSDETQAECGKPGKKCRAHLFQCSYGACVDGDAKCNGVQDCADNSDEANKDCMKPTENKCVRGRWQCSNGQCIDEGDVCDGKANCSDGSDETVAQCSTRKCKSFLVRCAYGACVDGDAECNNVVDCADGSDEDPIKCAGRPGWVAQEVTTTPTPRPTPTPTLRPPPVTPPTDGSSDGCKLPDFPFDGKYTVSNYGTKQIIPGDVVSEFTILTYSCKKGFDLTAQLSVCQEGNVWSEMPECNRRCVMPTSYTVDFKCSIPTGPIPCSATMPSGSTIHSECKDAHNAPEALLPLKCQGGSWDNTIPKCTPDCGLEKALSIVHVVGGAPVKKNTFPWHVAIFQDLGNPVPDQVCGGSLVRAHVVISAAHCFYDPVNSVKIDARYYKVACGKFYRSWDNANDSRVSYVQKSEIKELILHEGYRGDEQNQVNDVAIVVLATPFKLSDSVRPICFDLNNEDLDRVQVGPGKKGKVAGWGKTETGQPSDVLKSLELPIIDYNVCRLEMMKYQFQRYLTRDKLCAGYINGSALCQGDSGGGLVFPIEDYTQKTRWYLRGVVSNGPLSEDMSTCRASTYTAFTEIFKLKDWLSPQLRKLT